MFLCSGPGLLFLPVCREAYAPGERSSWGQAGKGQAPTVGVAVERPENSSNKPLDNEVHGRMTKTERQSESTGIVTPDPSRGDGKRIAELHKKELAAGERFAFGDNWWRFLSTLDEARITSARESLKAMLGVNTLEGLKFLDIGSGSGLFSLAAYQLGADVTSVDFDTSSVKCTTELRRRYAADTDQWKVEQGSVLDEAFMAAVGIHDVVYSWGVLHHTGNMHGAIERAIGAVAPGGVLFIALYNDQGAWSGRWRRIKRLYCSGPLGKVAVSTVFIPYWVLRNVAADLVWLRNPFRRYTEYKKNRGMSVVHDWHDWLGGYPFEVAKPEAIILPMLQHGFELTNLTTAGGSVGCVEYVFRRKGGSTPPES